MKFTQALHLYDTILLNGPLGTRLKYEWDINPLENLTQSIPALTALNELYKADIAIAQRYRLPMILSAATYRASKHHLCNTDAVNLDRINAKYIDIIKVLKDDYSTNDSPIFIAASIGSMYDAYNTNNIPSIGQAQTYHQEQLQVFKETTVDFVNAVTLPSLTEAIGVAEAAQNSSIDYTIGFILNDNGDLLDGTKLSHAITMIDAETMVSPLGYFITCTHTSTIKNLTNRVEKFDRLIGIQPNGSKLSKSELEAQQVSVCDPPAHFAREIIKLKNLLQLKIIGGCCGTTTEHIKALAIASTIDCRS